MALRKAFDLRARKSSGTLDKERMKSTIISLRLIPPPSETDIEQMCCHDEVTFEMFMTTIYMYMRSVSTADELIKAFRFFDRSKSGLIRFDDAMHILYSQGALLTSSQIEALRNEMRVDGNNMVDYVQFVRHIRPS